jgi:hypothetical protein
MGWKEQEFGSQLEQFETERSAFLKRPTLGTSALEAAAD